MSEQTLARPTEVSMAGFDIGKADAIVAGAYRMPTGACRIGIPTRDDTVGRLQALMPSGTTLSQIEKYYESDHAEAVRLQLRQACRTD